MSGRRVTEIEASAERDPLRALVPFAEALAGLLATDDPGAQPEWVRALSNAKAADVAALQRAWPAAPIERRRGVASALKALADDDFYVSFKAVFVAVLDDADPMVRATAIAGLWEATEPRLLDRYADLLANDPDPRVQAAAAEAIGPYIERSELDEIDKARVAPALALVLAAARSTETPLEVRCKAVASAGWSETPDAVSVISAAIGAGQPALAAAALTAIGRSAEPRWRDEVLTHLQEAHPAVLASAAFAAGQLGLKAAILPLARVAQEAPAFVRKTAIEALGEIGGYQATLALEVLAEAETDDDLLVAIDNAVEAATLGEIEIDDIEAGVADGAADGVPAVPGRSGVTGGSGADDDILQWLNENADPEDIDDWLDDDEPDSELDDEDDVVALGRDLRRAEDGAARAARGDFELDDTLPDAADVAWEDDLDVDRDAWAWDEGDAEPNPKP